MVGISSYGAYIPFYRLSRSEITRAWGGGALPGEKAVANYDEDSITMAVEAGIDCLVGIDRQKIDGLFFATTTSPYNEKQASSLIATALDLRTDILTADFTGSLKAGTTALRSAADAIKAGTANAIIVIASDSRLGVPGSDYEQIFGDAAAAFIVSASSSLAEVEAVNIISDEFVDRWRTKDDTFVKDWEDRFIVSEGYLRNIQNVASGLLNKYNLRPRDFAKAIISAPDLRSHRTAVKDLGFDLKTQVQDPLITSIGNTGVAAVFMMLAAALEETKTNDKIFLINYGDGADALVLKVIATVKVSGRRGIKGYLASKRLLASYEKYLQWRRLVTSPAARRPPDLSSLPLQWRDRKTLLAFYGQKCRQCGRVQFPKQRVCVACSAKDDFADYRLSDKIGTVFTFTKDYLAPSMDLPLIKAVVDFDGGGRTICQLMDRDPERIEIGMPVEMTFRKMHDALGLYNYSWKCRPIRGERSK